jgi:hypothetical protein
MGEKRSVKDFGGKPEGNRPLELPRHKWENGIKLDLGDIGWEEGRKCIHLAQKRDQWQALVNMVMNL